MDSVKEIALLIQDYAVSYTKATVDFTTLQQSSATLKKKYDGVSMRLSGTSSDIFQQGDILETLSKIIQYRPQTFSNVERQLEELSQDEFFPLIEGGTNPWYYLTARPTKAGSYSYVTRPFGDVKKTYTVSTSQFDKAVIPNITPYAFARESQRRIDEIDNNADTVTGDIMRRLLISEDSEPGLDPIIQCKVMDSLIQDMSGIDPFFASNFAEQRNIIKKSGIDSFTTWMTVDPKTDRDRAGAKNAIDRCRQNIQQAINKTRLERNAFIEHCTQFHPRFEWVGVLVKSDGKWYCVAKPGTVNLESEDLYILRRKTNQTEEPAKIGPVKTVPVSTNKYELRGNGSSLLQYAPVFLVQH